MLIEITSKPWNWPTDYPTMNACIDGDRDRLIQRRPDGSLWMDHMFLSKYGTTLEFVPIPEDATVVDRPKKYPW